MIREEQVATRGLTRRQLLRGMAIGGVAVAACGSAVSLLDAARIPPAEAGDIVLTTAQGWPFGPMPTPAQQAKDPVQKAYAATLKKWMDRNPGVTIKNVNTNIWDQQTLTTAVAAGTAPSIFQGNVLGGWDDSATRSAFVRGLAADVTTLLDRYQINSKVASYAQPLWKTWRVNGKYYGAPGSYNVGNGIYYRRDLIKEADLKEPQPGWTWEDFHTLAKGLTKGKLRGAAMQQWGIGWPLSANGFDLLTKLPAPTTNWHWRYDYMSNAKEWTRVVNLYRTMYFTDKSILSAVTYVDGDVFDAFGRGAAAMFPDNAGFYLSSPTQPTSPAALAKRVGKPLPEVVGWMQHPVGDLGMFGNTYGFIGLISFDPHLDPVALDKAVSLFTYLTFGQGYVDQALATFHATKDLKQVFTDVTPINGMTEIKGIPGTATDAWGTPYMKAVHEAAAIPLVPNAAWYFPPEQTAGIPPTAGKDAQTAFAFTQRPVAGILAHLQQVQNQQAGSLMSSIAKGAFIAGARAYYRAHDDFWRKHAPRFYEHMFHPWYEKYIVPLVGR